MRKVRQILRTFVVSTALIASSFASYGALSNWDRKGCAVGESPDGEVTAGYYDPKTFELRESISVKKNGAHSITRGRDAKGAEYKGYVRMYCDEPIIEMLGKERAKQILMLSR